MKHPEPVDLIGCLGLMVVCLLLWVLILTAISHIIGCSLTLESGIHDSLKLEPEALEPTPIPTPAR
jgi:hypothetical protein